MGRDQKNSISLPSTAAPSWESDKMSRRNTEERLVQCLECLGSTVRARIIFNAKFIVQTRISAAICQVPRGRIYVSLFVVRYLNGILEADLGPIGPNRWFEKIAFLVPFPTRDASLLRKSVAES